MLNLTFKQFNQNIGFQFKIYFKLNEQTPWFIQAQKHEGTPICKDIFKIQNMADYLA